MRKCICTVFALFFILLVGACTAVEVLPTATPQPSETPLTTWQFTHPENLYTLNYPIGWSHEVMARDGVTMEVIFTSPDYRMSEGYPVLEQGAEFMIFRDPLPEGVTSVEEYMNSNDLLNELAQNLTTIQVAGYPALQFDYSYEGVNAVMTIFIVNEELYNIRYRYVDQDSRGEYWDEYKTLLESFAMSTL